MDSLELLHLFQSDLPVPRAWEIVDWCHSLGADEFTLFAIGTEGGRVPVPTPFDSAALGHKLPSARRRHLSGPPGSDLTFPAELWQLTPGTLQALRLAFPFGPFDYRPADVWYEDLTLYRQGELILGTLTHEHEGILRVTAVEREELTQRGLPFRLQGECVGY